MKKIVFVISIALIAMGLLIDLPTGRSARAQSATPTPTPRSTAAAVAPALRTPTPSPTPPQIDDPNEIIKIDTELVNLNVRVIDRNSRPVNNIQQKEFKIFEDGVPQQIDFFSKSEVPTNYGIVVDNSGSMRQQLD